MSATDAEALGTAEASSPLDFLHQWITKGPAVAVLQGFSGVGKSTLVRELIDSVSMPAVYAIATDAGLGLEDLLLDIAAELEQAGQRSMADKLDRDLLEAFDAAMRTECLVVVDDFPRIADSKALLPPPELYSLLKRLARRPTAKARLLLVSDQRLPFATSLEIPIITLGPPDQDQAVRLLTQLLVSRGREDEIPPNRRRNVVEWVGRNPRALQAIVACLEDDSLDELIKLQQEAWDVRSQEFTPMLIRQLETAFWDRVMARLEPATLLLLELLSVYRKPFAKAGIERFASKVGSLEELRSDLANRFLLEHSKNWYFLNPVARELARMRLQANDRLFNDAHSLAADHFLRHFRAKGQSDLLARGSEFVEARYHSILVGRQQDFQELAIKYRSYLIANMDRLTKVPANSHSARQAASVLIAALGDQEHGYREMHYVLARILESFGTLEDSILALRHATLACQNSSFFDCWLLRVRLTARLDTFSATTAVLRQASSLLPQEALAHIYLSGIKVLISRGISQSDAISLLNEGLAHCGQSETSWVLYQLASVLLARTDRYGDAITLLMSHLKEAPATKPNLSQTVEHLALLAYAIGDRVKLSELRILVEDKPSIADYTHLVDVLLCQLSHDFDKAVEIPSNSNAGFLVMCHVVLAELCRGRPLDAGERLVASRRRQYSETYDWLISLVSFFSGHGAAARAGIESYLGHPIADDDGLSLATWLEAWDQSDLEPGHDVSFVFPRIPAELTGLEYDIKRLQFEGPVLDAEALAYLRTIRLPVNVHNPDSESAVPHRKDTDPFRIWPTIQNVIHLDQSGVQMGDKNYVGQAGAVGSHASAPNATFTQVSGNAGLDLATLAEQLNQLREALRELPSTPQNDLALAEVSRASLAAAEGDEAQTVSHLRAAGRWALDAANRIGVALAAAVIEKSIGLP